MNRVNKVERPASQGAPATSEQATQPSSSERFRKSQGGAHDTLQRVQLASDTERHVATRSKSTPPSSPKQRQEELGRAGASSLFKRLISPRKTPPKSTGQDAAQDLRSILEFATLISKLQEENLRLKEENGNLKETNRRLGQQLQITLSEFERQIKAKNGQESDSQSPSQPRNESLVTSFHKESNAGPVEPQGEQSATANTLTTRWHARQLSAIQRRGSMNVTATVTKRRVARTRSSPTFRKKNAGAQQTAIQTSEPLMPTASHAPNSATPDQPLTPAAATHLGRSVTTLKEDLERILATEAIDQHLMPLQRTQDGVNVLTPPRAKND